MLKTHHDRVDLRYGKDPRDRYGRTLAHLFLDDGSSVTETLLRKGLAAALTIPPNTLNAFCYLRAQRGARASHLAIWALLRYRTVLAADLPPRARVINPRYPSALQAEGLAL